MKKYSPSYEKPDPVASSRAGCQTVMQRVSLSGSRYEGVVSTRNPSNSA